MISPSAPNGPLLGGWCLGTRSTTHNPKPTTCRREGLEHKGRWMTWLTWYCIYWVCLIWTIFATWPELGFGDDVRLLNQIRAFWIRCFLLNLHKNIKLMTSESSVCTPLKFIMEPKNEGSVNVFPFQVGDFQVPSWCSRVFRFDKLHKLPWGVYMFGPFLGGGFKHFLVSPLLGEMIQID